MAPEFSRNHLQALIEQGQVSVDGKPATTASRKVLAGQQIAVVTGAQRREPRSVPEALAIERGLREDAQLIVIDKPAGLVVHPAAGNWSGTLLNALLAHHHRGAASLPRAGIVHRLDKDTSGLMVVGRTLAAVTALTRAIAAREVHRHYLAIAHGEVRPTFSIDAPIGRDPQSRVRMAVVASGKPARTDVRCVARRDGFSARCAAPCTPGARTRSASIWPRAGIRWWPTPSMADARRWQ